MKLIITGATGFVATELIRQSLTNPKITSVIALARRPVSTPSNLGPRANASKLHSVTVKDYDYYPDEVKKSLAGADACIWTVAITPSKSKSHDFEYVRRICQDYTLIGLQNIFEARGAQRSTPFRFLYMSGSAAERDQSKTPFFMPPYTLMRGETENQVLAFAAKHKDAMEACVAKPGLITAPGQYLKTTFSTVMNLVGVVPKVDVSEVSAAMLQQAINGWEKEPLENVDLVQIGRQALKDAAQ